MTDFIDAVFPWTILLIFADAGWWYDRTFFLLAALYALPMTLRTLRLHAEHTLGLRL